MTPESVALTQLFASVALLAYAWHLWCRAAVQRFRQHLFDLRAELFDYAADGHLAFEDPAYHEVRRQFNSLIRFAHRMTAWQLMIPAIVGRVLRQDIRAAVDHDLGQQMAHLSPDVRRQLAWFHRRMALVSLAHVASVSPVGTAILGTVDIARGLLKERRRILDVATQAPQQGMHARVDRIIELDTHRRLSDGCSVAA